MKLQVGFCAFAAICLALTPPLLSTQGDVDSKASKIADQIVRAHESWRSAMTTPGVSISAEQSGHEGKAVMYQLHVTGLPGNRLYSLMSWPVTDKQPSVVMNGVTVGKNGIVSCT